jgi:hypothetical protein
MTEKEYTVVAPDGKEITLVGPVGASNEEVIAQAQKLYKQPKASVTVTGAPIPEQGNMYTQGAEDVVYDANGIPQTTSSYGSANPYQKTAKTLNTFVSTPLNIATGAAKIPASLVQYYDKHFGGGGTGDNMVNAINQIEAGSQAQSGDIGKRVLQGSSIVGEAAPYLMSPLKIGAPTFLEGMAVKAAPKIAEIAAKGGKLVDDAIGVLPSFAQKVLPSANLVGNVAKGTAIGGATAYTSPEEVGLSLEEYNKAKSNKTDLGMFVGGGLPIVGKTLTALNTSTGLNLGRKLAETPSQDFLESKASQLFKEARDSGVQLDPKTFGGNMGQIAKDLRNEGYDPRLYPKIAVALGELKNIKTTKDFNELNTLRKFIMGAQRSVDPEEMRLATMLKADFDHYLANIPDTAVIGGSKEGLAAWKEARDTYTKLSKADIFTEMLEKAKLEKHKLTQSGTENALFKELRKLAENPKRMRLFTQAEQNAIIEAGKGGNIQNAMRFMSRFTPTGPVSGMFAGGALLAHPALAIPFEAASILSKAGATKIRKDSVKQLAAMMRAGYKPEMVSNPRFSQDQRDLARLLLLQGTERGMNK